MRSQAQRRQQSAGWRRAPESAEARELKTDLQAVRGVAARQLAPRPEVHRPRVCREVRCDGGADGLLQRPHACRRHGMRCCALEGDCRGGRPGRGRPGAPAATAMSGELLGDCWGNAGGTGGVGRGCCRRVT